MENLSMVQYNMSHCIAMCPHLSHLPTVLLPDYYSFANDDYFAWTVVNFCRFSIFFITKNDCSQMENEKEPRSILNINQRTKSVLGQSSTRTRKKKTIFYKKFFFFFLLFVGAPFSQYLIIVLHSA